jgi:hypothetical protein|eukprot:scaffold6631_cov287-Chaetoceros_neogracile.AAC.7
MFNVLPTEEGSGNDKSVMKESHRLNSHSQERNVMCAHLKLCVYASSFGKRLTFLFPLSFKHTYLDILGYITPWAINHSLSIEALHGQSNLNDLRVATVEFDTHNGKH